MTNSTVQSETSERSSSDVMKCPKLLVFGNPLLDVTIKISDDEILKKYDIEKNGQLEVPLDTLTNLFNDARARYRKVQYSLGGSGLNSSRILAALGRQKDLMFYGAIGNDQNGRVVKEILKRSGVNACLQELETRTGQCVCLCHGSDRSLTANIGAALECTKSHVQENVEKLTQEPSYYYIEGFFIPNKMDICRYLNEKFSENSNTIFITNLNAPYIVKTFPKDITWMVNKADIVFGNRDEFEELASLDGFQTMDDLIADLISKYEKVDKQKVIVITDGSSPVLLYEGNRNGIDTSIVEVPHVNAEDIVDTTGAGDSFVAGFISAHMQGEDNKKCIEFGCKISAAVIKTIGCNLPKGVKF